MIEHVILFMGPWHGLEVCVESLQKTFMVFETKGIPAEVFEYPPVALPKEPLAVIEYHYRFSHYTCFGDEHRTVTRVIFWCDREYSELDD